MTDRPSRATTACAALFALAGAAPHASARTLDRASVVQVALAQNPQIAAARAEEAAVAAQGRQVDAARLPFITLNAGVGPSLVATLVPGTAAQSTQQSYKGLQLSDLSTVWLGELSVIQPLYTFGKIALRGEAAAHGLRAREAQTRMQRADVAFAAAQIYEGYLFARDAERFLQEIDHWLDSTLEGTEEKLAQGVANVTERDVLRLQAAQGLADMGLHEARAGKAAAQAGLVAYLGIPAGEEITFADDEQAPVGSLPADPAALVTLAGDKRPELAALAEGKNALAALARAEAAGWWPDFFAMAFVSAAYTPGRDWIESRFIVDPVNHFVPGALLGLRWQVQGGMASARADEQQARADVLAHLGEWASAGIPAEVRKCYEDAARSQKDIESGREAVKKAKRWMVEASADYGAGFLDVRELSDAVEAYVTLRTAVMKATYEHNVAMAALARATGTLDGAAPLLYLAPRPQQERTGPQ